jgi:hypothetical protein
VKVLGDLALNLFDTETERCSICVPVIHCAHDPVWRCLMLSLRMNLETPPRDHIMRCRFTVKVDMRIVTITVSRVNVLPSDSQ